MPIPYIIGAIVVAAGYAAYKAITEDDGPTYSEDRETRDLNAEQRRKAMQAEKARSLISEFGLTASESDVTSWIRACGGNRDWTEQPEGKPLLDALEESPQWKALTQQIRDLETEMEAMDGMLRRLTS